MIKIDYLVLFLYYFTASYAKKQQYLGILIAEWLRIVCYKIQRGRKL